MAILFASLSNFWVQQGPTNTNHRLNLPVIATWHNGAIVTKLPISVVQLPAIVMRSENNWNAAMGTFYVRHLFSGSRLG